MSEQSVLTVIGLLIGALFTVIGFVISAMWTKLIALEKAARDFTAFVARFDATEKSWDVWRAGLEERLDAHASDIKNNGNRLTRIERNGH